MKPTRVCPKCGGTTFLGHTSGAGPVPPWKCDRCRLTWTEKEVRAAATATPTPSEGGKD